MKSCGHSQFLILNILQQHKKVLISDKKYSDDRVDVLSCLLIAEKMMTGPPTAKRMKVASVAISLCSGGRFSLKEDDLRQILSQMNILESLSNIKATVSRVCCTSFINPLSSAHQDILRVLFKGKH